MCEHCIIKERNFPSEGTREFCGEQLPLKHAHYDPKTRAFVEHLGGHFFIVFKQNCWYGIKNTKYPITCCPNCGSNLSEVLKQNEEKHSQEDKDLFGRPLNWI